MFPGSIVLSLVSRELTRESGFLFRDVRQQGAWPSVSTGMRARDVDYTRSMIGGTAASVHLLKSALIVDSDL